MAQNILSDYPALMVPQVQRKIENQFIVGDLKLLSLFKKVEAHGAFATFYADFSLSTAKAFNDLDPIQLSEYSNMDLKMAQLPFAKYRKPVAVPGTTRDVAATLKNVPSELVDFQERILARGADAVLNTLQQDLITGTGSDGYGTPTLYGINTALGVANDYAGINRSTVAGWRARVQTGAGALTLDMLRNMIQGLKQDCRRAPHVVVGNSTTCGWISKIADNRQQFISDPRADQSLGVAVSHMQVLGLPVVEMPALPDGQINILNLDTWEWHVLHHIPKPEDLLYKTGNLTVRAGSWSNEMSGVEFYVAPLPGVNGFSSFYEVGTPNSQIICTSPRCNGVITGVTAPV